MTKTENEGEEKHQILRLGSAPSSFDYGVAGDLGDKTRAVTMNMDDSFASWFQRPIKVAMYSWEINTPLSVTFNPWTLFFENPRVINRINNYNLLRSKLCVKFLINGNSFYYGRVLASYTPLQEVDDFALASIPVPEGLILETQKPHVYIDPTHSEAGTMCLPFVWWNNALSIPLAQWRQMGEMRLTSMNVLKHANGGADGIEISVLVWAEDIDLSVPTAADSTALSPQMGSKLPTHEDVDSVYRSLRASVNEINETVRQLQSHRDRIIAYADSINSQVRALQSRMASLEESLVMPLDLEMTPHSGAKDEFGKGPISRTATAVAKAAGSLRSVPIIGPYMMPTEMIAKTTATIAAAFGYARPAIVEDIHMYTPRYLGDLASTARPDTVHSLATEPKQSVTIDPRVVGVGSADEMTIESIACRESFVTTFPWADTATTDTQLFQIFVTPMLFDTTAGVGNEQNALYMTPSCFASLPFDDWHGEMEYHFQFVCSSFHRGRLRIVYEPHQFDSNEYNTNFSRIVDIQNEKDVTIKVGWGIDRPYLQLSSPGDAINPFPPFSTAGLGFTTQFDNGLLRVYVVNELTTPNSTVDNDIEVNVYARCVEGSKWANPRQSTSFYSYGNTPQMGCKTHVQEDYRGEVPPLWLDIAHAVDTGALTVTDLMQDCISLVDKLIPYAIPHDQALVVKQSVRAFARDSVSGMDPVDLVTKHMPILAVAFDVNNRCVPHSGEKSPEDENVAEHTAPMKTTTDDSFAGEGTLPDYERVFFGETIVSFRSLLKRYNLSEFWTVLSIASFPRITERTQNAFPRHSAWNDTGRYTGTLNGSSGPYNETKNTLLTYLTPAYVCRRGSIRYKIDGSPVPGLSQLYARRLAGGTTFTETSGNIVDTSAIGAAQNGLIRENNFLGGVQATAPFQNPVLEFEVPYMTPARFTPARKADLSTDTFAENAFEVTAVAGRGTATLYNNCPVYVAAGEDFSLSFYIGPPVMYYTPVAPTIS
jgi:hypothetical protein